MADFRDFWVILEIKLKPRTTEVLYRDGFSRRARFTLSGESGTLSAPAEFIGLIRELVGRLPPGRIPPHDTGPVPLPVFVHVSDFVAWFQLETWLAAALGLEIDLNRIQCVCLTRRSRTRRPRFRLPFRILTVGDPAMFGLDSISTTTWFSESPEIGEFGINIEASPEPAESLRQTPRDILVAPGPATSDPLYDLLSSLPMKLRPRLFINCSRFPRRAPEGVSVLHLPGPDPSRQIIPEVVYGLIHDMPLHEAVKSAKRRTGGLDMTLLTNPTANHDLRISDSLLELRRDALKLYSAFARPAPARTADLPKVFDILERNTQALGRIQRAVDDVYSNAADFSQETRGLKPLVRAESGINDARTAAETLGSELAELLTDKEARNQLAAEQRRTVDLALERLDTDMFLFPVESSCTLQTGARYQLRVHIGNRLPGSLVQGAVPPIDLLLPDPEQADGHWLEIAVQRKEFALLSERVRPAFLPRLGASEPVYFTIRAPREPGPATLRAFLYYRNHLLQSFLLETEVTQFEEFRNYNVTRVVLEYSRTERFTNLDELQPRAVSIGANRGLGDTHELFIKGARAGTVALGDRAFTDAMDDVRAILLAATVDPNDSSMARVYAPVPPGDAAPPEVAAVVRKLADKGHDLYAALFLSDQSSLALFESLGGLRNSSGETVQIVRFHRRLVFPWTLLYDFDPPDQGSGEVCLGYARDANGAPQACGHGPLNKVYCVRGFWGARHRVEELIGDGPAGDAVKTISRPQGAEPVRMAIDYTVPGADNLREHLIGELGNAVALGPIASQDLIQLLWEKPPKRPAVLLILGHLETGAPQFRNEPKGERIVLEPQKSWLSLQSISNQFIHVDGKAWDQPRPLVLLMACGSATTNVAKVNDFVLALNAAGAGAIVGTECVVFSDFACEFSQYLTLRLWKRNGGSQPVSLGEAMTAFRVKKLESGDPRAFVFRSIGDADLTFQS
jgi:hypothetical protein